MKPISVKDITAAVNGELLCGDENTMISHVACDSREVGEHTLFVPIKGERVDAHKFIESCLEICAATLTENDAPHGATKPYIKVKNTGDALQSLAAYYRSMFDIKIVGVTGSVGKTSTKEMVAAALSCGMSVMKTQGNKNSQIGLPLTMFDIEPQHETAVIEMGMSYFGEMQRLCSVAKPTFAVMTNIGTAHIENLKSQENILKEKLKITNEFKSDSVLFLNGDDALLSKLCGTLPFKTVTFGFGNGCDYRAENVETVGMNTRFTLIHLDGREEVEIPALGSHNVQNALAAFAVGEALGLDAQTIKKGLLTYKNAPMRQQIHKLNGFTLIDDSYNASPDAMRVSIDVLKSLESTKTIAVLADMLELGEYAKSEHFAVGEHLANAGIDSLITVGELAKNIADGAKSVRADIDCMSFDDNESAIEYLKTQLTKGCAVLVKGSRSMHTEQIVKGFMKL